ncbi:MAG: CvpA family protein [Patescibacteria group bacterium]
MMPIIVSVVIVLAFLGFIATGYKDGLIQTLGRMLGAVAGFVLARSWSTAVAGILAKFLPANWSQFIAIVAIFVIASRAVGLAAHILEVTFRIITMLPIIKTINKLAGVVAGAVEGVVMIGGIIWVLKTTTAFPEALKWLDGAFMAKVFVDGFNFLLKFVI